MSATSQTSPGKRTCSGCGRSHSPAYFPVHSRRPDGRVVLRARCFACWRNGQALSYVRRKFRAGREGGLSIAHHRTCRPVYVVAKELQRSGYRQVSTWKRHLACGEMRLYQMAGEWWCEWKARS